MLGGNIGLSPLFNSNIFRIHFIKQRKDKKGKVLARRWSEDRFLTTFQCLMMVMFHDFIGKFVHIYFDNIFLFSNSLEEHIAHIVMVLQ